EVEGPCAAQQRCRLLIPDTPVIRYAGKDAIRPIAFGHPTIQDHRPAYCGVYGVTMVGGATLAVVIKPVQRSASRLTQSGRGLHHVERGLILERPDASRPERRAFGRIVAVEMPALWSERAAEQAADIGYVCLRAAPDPERVTGRNPWRCVAR